VEKRRYLVIKKRRQKLPFRSKGTLLVRVALVAPTGDTLADRLSLPRCSR
jgi:hypothetical protein